MEMTATHKLSLIAYNAFSSECPLIEILEL